MNYSFGQLATDAAELPYEVDYIVNVIEEGVEQPTAENAYLEFLIDEPDFPFVEFGQEINDEYRDSLTKWVKNHPASIEKMLIRRKKSFDKFSNQNSNNE